ncbi:hypothetical protein DdX_13334 [Ditylenchus destructor]|uniref:Uncharacterized protein n=1 Tax=Ditylenchus destructor TaxID=166010 RepID=A0AAD4R2W2_9BILA|nr:hypothetical protein DdX_13334 [Ditylenchus destructor]
MKKLTYSYGQMVQWLMKDLYPVYEQKEMTHMKYGELTEPKNPHRPDLSSGFTYGYFSGSDLDGAVVVDESFTKKELGIQNKPTILAYGVRDVGNRDMIAEMLLKKAIEETKTKFDSSELYALLPLVEGTEYVKAKDKAIFEKLKFTNPNPTYPGLFHANIQKEIKEKTKNGD